LIILGIDIGLKGYLCEMNSDYGILKLAKMPLKKGVIDLKKLNEIFQESDASHACMERLWGTPMRGSAGNFSVGYSCGTLKALLFANYIEAFEFTPQTWQKYFFGKNKVDTKVESKKLFEVFTGEETKNDNLSDSYLIARYGMDFLKKSLSKEKICA
jgi:Holliday junction resolvasome RuvABC endonuclease subunit